MKKWMVGILLLGFCCTVQADLVSQWKLDGNTFDSIGSNHGTILDPPLTYVAGAPKGAEPGGKAGQFDGVVRVNVGQDASLQSQTAVSFSCWIKVEEELSDAWQHMWRQNTSGKPRTLFAVGTWAGDEGLWLGVRTDTTGYTELVGTVTDAQMRDGNWHLAVATYDSSVSGTDNMFLYWDDAVVGSMEIAGSIVTTNRDATIGGVVGGTEPFIGGIDDFRVYNNALTLEEVQQIYRGVAIVITETDGSTDVTEGGATDTYDITIFGQYSGHDVSVQVSPGPQLDVGAGVDTPINLNFTSNPSDPNNWTVHTVTVTAYDDSVSEADHIGVISHLSSSSDPNFSGLTKQLTVNIADNDGSAVLSKTTASVSEDGAQDQYSIHLEGSPPASDVILTINTTDQAGVDIHVLTFNSGNYMTPQIVTIAAIDDNMEEGTHQTTFTHTLTGDAAYAGLPVDDMVVTITDNDMPAPDLIAQWKFDGDMTDATGNGHDGSPNGDPNYIAGAPYGDDPGGQALNVDVSGQGCVVPHDAALKPLNGITLAAWIKPDVYLGDPWQNIIRKEDGGSGRYLFEIGAYGGSEGVWLGLVIGGAYRENVGPVDPAVLTDGQWHHVAGTYDGSAMKIYFDGEEKFSANYSGTLGQSGTAPLRIGFYGSTEFFDGGIDDVRIYNYGLSVREIQALMSLRASNPDPANGAVEVETSKVLSWTAPAGISSPTYNVYVDTDFTKVDLVDPSGQVQQQSIGQSGVSFDPSPDLDVQSDIFWRVDVTDGPTTYPGVIWHFDTKIICNDAFPLRGDISSPSGKPDCRVDLYDFARMAAEWLQCNQIPLSRCQ